jgi:hypothetical protein
LETIRQVGSYRHIAAELIRAFAVLALVFLSFAHQPVHLQSHGGAVLTAGLASSFCGDAPADDGAHAPCHACRIGGGADLPPPCEGLLHLPTASGPAYRVPPVIALTVAPPDIPDARGPPTLA